MIEPEVRPKQQRISRKLTGGTARMVLAFVPGERTRAANVLNAILDKNPDAFPTRSSFHQALKRLKQKGYIELDQYGMGSASYCWILPKGEQMLDLWFDMEQEEIAKLRAEQR